MTRDVRPLTRRRLITTLGTAAGALLVHCRIRGSVRRGCRRVRRRSGGCALQVRAGLRGHIGWEKQAILKEIEQNAPADVQSSYVDQDSEDDGDASVKQEGQVS